MTNLPTILRFFWLASMLTIGCGSGDNADDDSRTSGGRGGASASSTRATGGGEAVSRAAFVGDANVAGSSAAPSTGVAGATGAEFGSGGASGGASGMASGVAGSASATTESIGGTAGGVGTAQFYRVSGTVTGLSGSGLELAIGTGTPLAVGSDGPFTFPAPIAAGSVAVVKVAAQPTAPNQTCTVSASGVIPALLRDVTDVQITCKINSYAVGGTITGLSGSGLVITNTTGDELTIGRDGRFAFPTKLSAAQAFAVGIKKQPLSPAQTCTVSGGAGTIVSGNVTSVAINCSTNTYSVGGTLTGLAGTGLVLRNNTTDLVTLTAQGAFAFPTPILSGKPFAVSIEAQPTAPKQTCVVTNATGTVANGNVDTISVACTTNTYAIRGSVTGLAGSGLTLQNNLADNLAVTSEGPFSFATAIASGTDYSVTILTQPTSPSQDCTVTAGAGPVVDQDIPSVVVSCVTKKYTVGGTLVGLASDAGLVLRNNDGDDLTLNADGSFVFATALPSGQNYAITVHAQPAGQFCSLVGGRGTLSSANVTSVTVNCAEDKRTVGGNIIGLAGSGLHLALNDYVPEALSNSGDFAFREPLAVGSLYSVVITQQPTDPWQTCALTNATGVVGATDVLDVEVNCVTNAFAVGGTITGLFGQGLVLQNNLGDDLVVEDDGSFAFPSQVASGSPYSVTVLHQPTSPAQTCKVTNGGGRITGADVGNVQIVCTTNPYSIGGGISGLAGSVVLSNGSETLRLTGDGEFTFATLVNSGDPYDVRVVSHPSSPVQICSVTNGAGTVESRNVTDVTIRCVTQRFTIGGTVLGLGVGKSVVLQNNGGDELVVTGEGSFTFATPIVSGGSFEVAVGRDPAGQVCTVSGGNGTVASADITSLSVNCTDLRILSGTVTGLSGKGLVLRNGSEDLAVSSSGTFAFKTLYLDGSTYAVSVTSQPTGPWQTCSVDPGTGTGSVSGDVSSIRVTCASNPHAVRVNVTGLGSSGLVLQNNAVDTLAIPASGIHTFASPVLSGQDYRVAIVTQPESQSCSVSASSGTIADADVTVAVNCVTNNYTVGGTVIGYVGAGIVLRNNGVDLSVTATGTFTFTTRVATGSSYAVSLTSQPAGMVCGVTNATGTIANANVTNVIVNCPGYLFDSDTQGWAISDLPAGIPQPSWSNAVGNPTNGALLLSLPFTPSNCRTLDLKVTPPTTNATGKTLKAWIRIDAFPTSDRSGVIQLFAQDAGWRHWEAQMLQLNTFALGTWRQMTLPLPSSGDWTSITSMGLQLNPGGSATCQTATIYVDSVIIE